MWLTTVTTLRKYLHTSHVNWLLIAQTMTMYMLGDIVQLTGGTVALHYIFEKYEGEKPCTLSYVRCRLRA